MSDQAGLMSARTTGGEVLQVCVLNTTGPSHTSAELLPKFRPETTAVMYSTGTPRLPAHPVAGGYARRVECDHLQMAGRSKPTLNLDGCR